jgi:voltage-gated potassium channel
VPDHPPRSRFRVGSRLDARVTRVVANRRIFPFLVLVTVSVALLAGFVATLVDEKDFPSFADGAWWAIVTLATVGYGDIVPTTAWGRVVGSVLIIFGVTFLSFLTAIVTSLFVSTDQDQRRAEERALQEASEAETRTLLLQLDERLASIEAKLEQ